MENDQGDYDAAYADALREEDESSGEVSEEDNSSLASARDEVHGQSRIRGALHGDLMQAAHRCIAALDEGQRITPLDLHNIMLDDNLDIEQRVGDDEDNAQVMIFAPQKALDKHIQLGAMRLCGLRGTCRCWSESATAERAGHSPAESD